MPATSGSRGPNVRRDVRLQVGSLQETVSVRASEAASETVRRMSRPASTESRCTPAAGGVGGNIVPSIPLVSVVPRYPASLAAAKRAGVVVLDARIGEDGRIREVRTVSSPHPDFEQAARDAVRQWEFSRTLLNCVPVEIAMRVTVNFLAE